VKFAIIIAALLIAGCSGGSESEPDNTTNDFFVFEFQVLQEQTFIIMQARNNAVHPVSVNCDVRGFAGDAQVASLINADFSIADVTVDDQFPHSRLDSFTTESSMDRVTWMCDYVDLFMPESRLYVGELDIAGDGVVRSE